MLIRCWYSTPRKRRRTWKGIATAALTRRWVAPLVVAAAAADTRSTRMGRRGRGGDGRVPTRILPIIIAITRKAARAGFLSTLFDQEVGHGGGCLGPTYCIAFAFVFPTMEMPNNSIWPPPPYRSQSPLSSCRHFFESTLTLDDGSTDQM